MRRLQRLRGSFGPAAQAKGIQLAVEADAAIGSVLLDLHWIESALTAA